MSSEFVEQPIGASNDLAREPSQAARHASPLAHVAAMRVDDERDASPASNDEPDQPGRDEHVRLDTTDRPEAKRIRQELRIDQRGRHAGLHDAEARHARRALTDEDADARPVSRRPDPGQECDGAISAHRRRMTRSSCRAWVGRTIPVPMRIGG